MNGYVDTDELTELRAEVAASLPDTGVILEATTTRDDAGARRKTWEPVTWAQPDYADRLDWPAPPAVPVRLGRPTAGELTLLAERLAGRPGLTVTLPYGAPFTLTERLEVVLPTGAYLLEPIAELVAPSSYATSVRMAAVEVVEGG